MNSQIATVLQAAIGLAQIYAGEAITLGGVLYTCTPNDAVAFTDNWEQGGAAQLRAIGVCISQVDLPTQPAIDTHAVFRNQNYRVFDVKDSVTLWQIGLVQIDA